MSKIKKIPYGRTDLETIICEGYYYVDKTRFIPRLEDEGSYVIFLRPRNKRQRPYQQRFEARLSENLEALCHELWTRTYRPRPSTCFIILPFRQFVTNK